VRYYLKHNGPAILSQIAPLSAQIRHGLKNQKNKTRKNKKKKKEANHILSTPKLWRSAIAASAFM